MVQNPLFIISYVGSVFCIILLYKYLKIYRLKKQFKDQEKGNRKLKRYMKTDELPKKEEVYNNFLGDKKILGKGFYLRIAYLISVVGLLIIINTYYFKLVFLDILIIFVILNLIYRYIFLTHLDKKIFNERWEKEKIKKYMDEYIFNETNE
ncbi:hypothetical protein ALNOE001_12020 [Candidatus Methanobinarius endosymbioticus]|uniref:Uncharacterized protein n=1 Tax=Candidatus Methanobinarius endosymbioticus TaxID=2006182 RepID=A0A366MAN4_9EURY|nr:hypothetical protein ALNOE001_12020 [Candidatus Methanobinarius endosymbioticus]